MRKILAMDFAVEFVSLIALIISIALAWLGYVLGLSVPVVVTASIGIMISVNIWALKWWIRREINQTMTLYKLLESIDDEELYERGKTAIEECRIELENLSHGLLLLDPKSYKRDLIDLSSSARRHVRLTHVGLDARHWELINPAADNRWHQHICNLVQRGIQVERILILHRCDGIDDMKGKLKTDLANSLRLQMQDGIKVYLVWEEQVDADLIQEVMIVDTTLVLSGMATWSGSAFSEWKLSRRSYDVSKALETFNSLVAFAHQITESDDLMPSYEEG